MTIGAQMYTLRELCQTPESFDGALRRVAAIGYRAVQISGCGDFGAEAIRAAADRHGLSIILTHTAPQKIKDDAEAVIQAHKTMGAGYVGIGMMPGEYHGGAEGVSRFIQDFTPAAERIAAAGLKLMYHNHSFEFERYGGHSVLDRLAEGFAPSLLGFTLDTYWIAHGGGDPAFWLEKLSGRVDTVHLKDMKIIRGEQRMGEVLEGNLNWEAIFKAAGRAGVKWGFVEQDDCYGGDPFACLETSYRNIAAFTGAAAGSL
ncbi:MAG: sugar phosphate isomerase/epimerase [Oscillospiraceae bacterium]|jgi:sugar phosphate isomerase/epimerase|nr:sugar phosphate isomerase/epimerase [Oscillospiraceae bacterium]